MVTRRSLLEVPRHIETDSARASRLAQRRWKPGWWAFLKRARPLPILTAPLIYSIAVPLVLLDLWMSVYQWVCFPIYGLPPVRHRDYIAIDRHRLAYLNVVEKAHCAYCSYANGVLGYAREIAARTERYWCPIKHARPVAAPHSQYDAFFEYGDARGYRLSLDDFRRLPHVDDALAPAERDTRRPRSGAQKNIDHESAAGRTRRFRSAKRRT